MRPTTKVAALVAVALLVASGTIATATPSTPVRVVADVEFTEVYAKDGDVYSPRPTPESAEVIVDRMQMPVRPTQRPKVVQPAAKVVVVSKTQPSVQVVMGGGTHSLTGKASWYCWPAFPSPCAKGFAYGGNYAAAGPKLRAAICGIQSCTSWRGRYVYVNGIRVRLIDWCQCLWHQGHEKIIDLYHNVFTQTGGNVTITW